MRKLLILSILVLMVISVSACAGGDDDDATFDDDDDGPIYNDDDDNDDIIDDDNDVDDDDNDDTFDDDSTDDDTNDDDTGDDDTSDDDTSDDDTGDDDTGGDDDTSDNALTVGGSETFGPVAWRRDGKGWSVLSIPGTPSLYPLRGVDAHAPNGAFMVGGYGTQAEVYELAGNWLLNRSFECVSCWQYGVSARSAQTVFTAGCYAHAGYTDTRVWQRDDDEFAAMTVTEPNSYGLCIANDVAFIDHQEAVVVGRDGFTDDGIVWLGNANDGFEPEELPYISGHWRLDAVDVCENGDIVAVGNNDTNTRGLAVVYDGDNWQVQSLPQVSDEWELFDVSCRGNVIWLAGVDHEFQRGVVISSQGGWFAMVMPDVSADWGLAGVAKAGDGTGYAVGYDYQNSKAVILRRSNLQWKAETLPLLQRDQPLYDVTILR